MEEIIVAKKELDFGKSIDSFLSYIDVSAKTIDTYRIALKQFIGYLYQHGIKTPSRDDIIAYREHIMSYLKPTSVNGYMIAIRNLYKWLEYEEITKDITRNVKGVKIGNEHRKESLTLEQCKEVLDSAKDLREKAIFMLTISCGIRANELINIKLEDFKDKQGKKCLYLLGKGRDYKEDFVIIDNSIYNILLEYINTYQVKEYLFVSSANRNNGGMLTTKTIRLIVKDMFKRIGLNSDDYSFHSLRHTFATLSLLNGEDIRVVSQALRHKNLATTQIYAHDLDKIQNKCSNIVSNAILG